MNATEVDCVSCPECGKLDAKTTSGANRISLCCGGGAIALTKAWQCFCGFLSKEKAEVDSHCRCKTPNCLNIAANGGLCKFCELKIFVDGRILEILKTKEAKDIIFGDFEKATPLLPGFLRRFPTRDQATDLTFMCRLCLNLFELEEKTIGFLYPQTCVHCDTKVSASMTDEHRHGSMVLFSEYQKQDPYRALNQKQRK